MASKKAKDGMVLCDGVSKTSVGGTLFYPDGADISAWVDMTDEEAEALINPPEPVDEKDATEEDYLAALEKLGVTE